MEKYTPAWQQLEETGIQSADYIDSPRSEIYPLFKNIPKKILDVGCYAGGVGFNLKKIYPHVFVWGCEPNKNAAKIARTRLDRVSDRPISEWDDLEITQLKEIDTVLLLDVLEHMYNPWAELQFLSRCLQRNVQVILSIPNIGNLNILSNLARGNFHYEPSGILDVTHIRFFTAYEMRRMIYQTGFKIEEQRIFVGGALEEVPEFPAFCDMGHFRITVRDLLHWQELNAIQFAFRISIASDNMLNAEELELRYGKNR